MSPRLKVPSDCPYGECDQYYSLKRGVLTRTIICRHPDKEGCLCTLDPLTDAVCEFHPEEKKAQAVRETVD